MEARAEYRGSGPDFLRPLGETEFVLGLAKASQSGGPGRPPVLAMVGHADLRLGQDVRGVLEAHLELAGGFFKGIRHVTAADHDPNVREWSARIDTEVMRSDDFLAGVCGTVEAWAQFR